MENLTKEEFIEKIIESLGDNEVLGQVISIEQIKDILEDKLEAVHWDIEGEVNAAALTKNKPNGKTELFFRKYDEATKIHEVLHLLSNKMSSEILKFQVEKHGLGYNYNLNLNKDITASKQYNLALNEGMTEALAMK